MASGSLCHLQSQIISLRPAHIQYNFILSETISVAPTDLELTKIHLLSGSGSMEVSFLANVSIWSVMNRVLVLSSAICLTAAATTDW